MNSIPLHPLWWRPQNLQTCLLNLCCVVIALSLTSEPRLSPKPGMSSGTWLCYSGVTESTFQKSQKSISKNSKTGRCVEFYSAQEATDNESNGHSPKDSGLYQRIFRDCEGAGRYLG